MRNPLFLPTILAAVFIVCLSFTAVVFGGVRFGDLTWQGGEADAVDYTTESWTLRAAAIDGENVAPLTESHLITLAFDKGQIDGEGECSTYHAFYGLENDVLQLSSLSVSPQTCDDADVEEAESSYFTALDRVNKIGRSENVISLHGDGVVLTFDADK